eukprot:m51a1_g2769 hypothetical protein (805) ;mRNA; f:1013444-1016424
MGDWYNSCAGRSKVDADLAQLDKYGNAQGSQFDLARDGAFETYPQNTIAVLHLYTGEGFDFEKPRAPLEQKGFKILRWTEPPSLKEFRRVLLDEGKCGQLWVISADRSLLPDDFLPVIKEFFLRGNGVYLWGDNEPYYVDANRVAEYLIGSRLAGNEPGGQVVSLRTPESPKGSGFVEHLITTGLVNMYEGITISIASSAPGVEPLVYSTCGRPVTAVYDVYGRRALLDGGFTRLFCNWDTAGTGRYVVNAAAWLANVERLGAHPSKPLMRKLDEGQLASRQPPRESLDAGPSQVLHLIISCTGLMNKDLVSKSDPMVILYETVDGKKREVGRTEIAKDNLNPRFQTPLVIKYFFERVQKLEFACYDIDDPSGAIDRADFLGSVQCALAEIVTCKSFSRDLQVNGHSKGKMAVCVEEEKSDKEVRFVLSGRGLDKKDLFGKSDPYVIVHQALPDGTLRPVHQTEVVKKTLDPRWAPLQVHFQELCNCDLNRRLVFKCFDWDQVGSHDFIGQAEATLGALLSGDLKELPLINPEKTKKKKYTNSGVLVFNEVALIKSKYTFTDYLSAGSELRFIVAVDFTASNEDPSNPASLHHVSDVPNPYIRAITAVGEVISYYDRTRMFPAFGFGAQLPSGAVSHCFPLSGDASNPAVPGVEGILRAYHAALSNVKLYTPTNLAEIIRNASSLASSASPGAYYVLLVITDGVITDMELTVNAIVEASSLPLSVVVVGVGSEDFKLMEYLDADDSLLIHSQTMKESQRDIVQFVPFSKYSGNQMQFNQALMEEIPGQFVEYMQSKGFKPAISP